jgi:hypothetical protein
MNKKPYAYRREDDDTIVWVDFQTMMGQDRAGYITLPDGVEARRCHSVENAPHHPRAKPVKRAHRKPVPALALGFPDDALAEREAQRREWGCTDIEFKRDPLVPEFIEVHAGSEKARDEYAKRRNMVNRTGSLGGGVMLSEEELKRAEELASR